MDSLAYFRAVRRHWLVVVACVVVGAALGVASTRLESTSNPASRPAFKATHTLFFEPSQASALFTSAFSNLDQMAVLTTTGPVPNAVADELGGDKTGRELAEQITTLANPTTNTLEITAVDGDADRAVDLSDTFAEALVENLVAKDIEELDDLRERARAEVADLQAQIDSLSTQIVAAPPNLEVLRAQLVSATSRYSDAFDELRELEDADEPTSPLSTLEPADAVPIERSEFESRLALGRLGTNNINAGAPTSTEPVASTSSSAFDGEVPRGVLGGLIGLFAGFGLAVFAERLDRRLRTREAVEEAFQLPVLADVPKLAAKDQAEFTIVSQDAPVSPAAETYRSIRSALLFQHAVGLAASSNGAGAYSHDARPAPSFDSDQIDPIIVMVASASPKEGKTTTTANLAAVFAETGSSVLVVNCDFRRPLIHRYLGIEDTPRRVVGTRIPGVKAITNVLDDTDDNPARIVAEQRRLINAARGQFDVMILDTAPLLSANDAVELVGCADLVLLVAKAEQSTTIDAARAIEMLERVNAPVAGVVFMGASEMPNSYYNYYRREAANDESRRRRRDKRTVSVSTNGIAPGSTQAADTEAPREP